MATTVPLEQAELRRPGYGRSRHRGARLALTVVLVALVGLAAILASQTARESVTVPAVPQIDETTALRSLQVRGLVPTAVHDPEAAATARFASLGLIPTQQVITPQLSSEDLAIARLIARGLVPDSEAVVTARLVNQGLVPAATTR